MGSAPHTADSSLSPHLTSSKDQMGDKAHRATLAFSIVILGAVGALSQHVFLPLPGLRSASPGLGKNPSISRRPGRLTLLALPILQTLDTEK